MTKPTLFPESGFRRLRVDISYDGTNFFGWAVQPDRRTIQFMIEEALSKIARIEVETVVAGRTDAGVHATGQVIHVDVPQDTEIDNLLYKLNRILDQDVRTTAIYEAPEAFHARFSALRRHYEYRILDNNQVMPPLARLNTAAWYRKLDLDLLNQAGSLLLGTHDFVALSKYREGATTVRTLEKFEWHRDEAGFLIARVAANAFCYSMVRNLVGAVSCVAEGSQSLEWLKALLENKERVSDSMVYPAHGLTLVQVDYPDAAGLVEFAKNSLARREEESN
jgi:tRNA pseudouridine38-40 synthase